MSFSFECAAILFDLDGVLVDSATCVEATWRRWAGRHGLDAAHVIDVSHGRRTIETVRLVAPHLTGDEEVAALIEREATTTEGVFEIPGARELVERLPRDRWAIVTSGTRPVATLRIQHTRLAMPNVLICADEIQRGKPDPEGYLTAAARLGVVPETCVVVEDAVPGVEAGHAAGMRVIGITGSTAPSRLVDADWTVSTVACVEVEMTADGTGIWVTSRG